MKNFVDVVLDLQMGDSAKGKITHHLASGKSGKKYTHVLRGNGGGNAGHSIYHHGKKFITHIIPAGVFHNIRSIIGPGCVINVEGLIKEINSLKAGGIDVAPYLRIANNAHIVTGEHLQEEQGESAVGTTRRGNGPAYRDKYARKGVRAETVLRGTPLQEFLIDMQEEFYGDSHNPSRVLYEGAQGFYLDIDWGDYPYVTSSHCGIGGVLLNGFNHKQIDTVYGAIKCYETYVGAKQFEDASNPVFQKIREIGEEYGATCMPKGELVLTSFGYLPVEKVKVGHEVITHLGRVRKVIDTSTHDKNIIYKVTLENGLCLKTNGKHQYYTTDGTWVEAKHLKLGDEIKVHSNVEIWKQLKEPNLEFFEISSWGRIRNSKTNNIVSQSKHGKWGHLKVTLTAKKAKYKKDFAVHRLVAKYFLEENKDFETLEVRHLNGIAWDNNFQNLKLGTAKENRNDAIMHGTMSRRRENAHGGFRTTKLSEQDVEEIRNTPRRNAKGWYRKSIPSGVSDKSLAEKYGVARETIRDIRLGKRWKKEPPQMLKEKVAIFDVSKVISVEILSEEIVYGLTVEQDESHVTAGIVTHNTGRPRQVNWINLDRLDTAVTMNGVDTLVISKVDVLREVNVWNTIVDGNLIQHQTEVKFKAFIESRFRNQNILWSDSPERI
jgi:adenylosuccinate synthase